MSHHSSYLSKGFWYKLLKTSKWHFTSTESYWGRLQRKAHINFMNVKSTTFPVKFGDKWKQMIHVGGCYNYSDSRNYKVFDTTSAGNPPKVKDQCKFCNGTNKSAKMPPAKEQTKGYFFTNGKNFNMKYSYGSSSPRRMYASIGNAKSGLKSSLRGVSNETVMFIYEVDIVALTVTPILKVNLIKSTYIDLGLEYTDTTVGNYVEI